MNLLAFRIRYPEFDPTSESLNVRDEQDKRTNFAPHEFGYTGVHFDVCLRRGGTLAGLMCEVQLHTPGEAGMGRR